MNSRIFQDKEKLLIKIGFLIIILSMILYFVTSLMSNYNYGSGYYIYHIRAFSILGDKIGVSLILLCVFLLINRKIEIFKNYINIIFYMSLILYIITGIIGYFFNTGTILKYLSDHLSDTLLFDMLFFTGFVSGICFGVLLLIIAFGIKEAISHCEIFDKSSQQIGIKEIIFR